MVTRQCDELASTQQFYYLFIIQILFSLHNLSKEVELRISILCSNKTVYKATSLFMFIYTYKNSYPNRLIHQRYSAGTINYKFQPLMLFV